MFLDECGFSLNLYRLYGWASSSERCVESVPLARGQNRSLVGGFSLSGMVASLQKVGSIKRVDFETFLSEHLLPVLPTGSVLVLDNARSHHGGKIASLVESSGCSLLYLPPYSPDFSPIELAWSFVKGRVRLSKPRDDEHRRQAITEALAAVPGEHASAWFRKCGYRQS